MITPRVLTNRVVISDLEYPSADLVLLMLDILSQRRTGSLTINYCDGNPSGTITWSQRTDKGLDTMGHFVLPFSTGDQSVGG